jgi:alanine-synthesizing transaminase
VSAGARPPFSNRLVWPTGDNRLAQLEAARRAAGRPVLDLTVTNPTRVGLPYPDALTGALATRGLVRYDPSPFGLLTARRAVAADYQRRGAVVDPRTIALTASSSESYALLFKLLARPGDALLVPQPSYPLFDYLARLEGLEPRPYRLVWDGRWRMDLDGVDLDRVRVACVVSPNNPTGSLVHREDLAALEVLAADWGIALVVDEVFADYAPTPRPVDVTNVAAASPRALTFCLGGLSKSAGLPQMKLGWIAMVGPDELVDEALPRLELVCDTYLSAGTAVQLALPHLLEVGAEIRTAISDRVRSNRRVLTAVLASQTPCNLMSEPAGWSAVVRLPAVMSDEDWAVRLLDDGVLVQPGYFFDMPVGASVVLSLLAEPAAFAEGVRRILSRASTAVMLGG